MAIEKQINKTTPNNDILEIDDMTGAPAVVTEYDDGTTEFDYDAVEELEESLNLRGVINPEDEHFTNLAEDLDQHELMEISSCVVEQYDGDKESISEHMETIASGMKLLGVKLEEVNEPFPGACGAHHPLITENAVKFQAKAAAALFPSKGPVKTRVLGEHTDDKEDRAKRVRAHMNYQITEEMEEYFPEMERMLFHLPIVGTAFKKVYYNGVFDRPASEFVPLDSFVTNYHTTNLTTAPSFTHVIHRTADEFKKDIVNGLYSDLEEIIETHGAFSEQGVIEAELDEELGHTPYTDEEVYTLLEHYCFLEVPGDEHEDGIARPYVVTIEKESESILSIRRGWRETDANYERIVPFIPYTFIPGPGFFGLGYIHLLGNIQVTLTTVMRSLVDSGQFANLQGGFIDKRMRNRGGDGPIAFGEFKDVETGGIPINQLIYPLNFKEPSQVLLQMFQFIEARGQKFADTTEQVVADSTNYGPVGTTLALLEESQKFFSGVHRRLYLSQKKELRILAAINYEYLEDSMSFDTIGRTFNVTKEDYAGGVDIVPEADPNLNSQAQKLTTAQGIYTAALQNPVIHDLPEVTRYYYESMGVDDERVKKFVPIEEQATPSDPLTDLLKLQKGSPIAAFPGQDHDSHMMAKSAFLQDPNSGGSPAMAPLVPLIQANIQEHIILKFKEQTAALAASGEAQGSTEEQIVAQAAQKLQQQSQRLMELEAQGPDTARNKLADAELLRVSNETAKLEAETMATNAELTLKAMQLQLTKLKEDNKMLIAGIKQESAQSKQTMDQVEDLLELAEEEQKQSQQAQLQQRQQVDNTGKDDVE